MKILGIMQPYFFPYLGYFSLIKSTQKWIVFDTPQYTKYSWLNRNRILKPNFNDWMYVNVPLTKHKLKTPIKDIQIQNQLNWKEKLFAQIVHYRKHAPCYKQVEELLRDALKPDFESLVDLNVHILSLVCKYIGVSFDYQILTKMELQIEPAAKPDEWALNICKALGIKNYINAEGGQAFFQKDLFKANSIEVKFLEYGYPNYDQKTKNFIPGLSVLDAMMFNTPSELNQLLDGYKLVS